ncbi:DUF1909-domain-containing protein [Fomitiporia mediterranea MF3/22]|uniref:DUF1909-domain-containing protein n=1 Tax=Fomitiporia mediterranea (strain MF3/22) TaxID=694068 RepID=UPI0004409B2D|nr:DUF1909-domain-containing protein [Fomitiporia mediterranea MF3/22]EJD04369.1 DUF1909-domain-containing protein [Fomitiporia mediterranea MF3/22]
MGNGAKAQQRRDRAEKAGPKAAKSQLKTNEAAKNIQCKVCRQMFMLTTRLPQLVEHAENRHKKTKEECFD